MARARGAHAAPGRIRGPRLRSGQARRALPAPHPLPGLVLVLTGGGLAALAVLPAASAALPSEPVAVLRAAAGTAPQAVDLAERRTQRASRSRVQPEPAPPPSQAVPVPAVVAPRPVLPGCAGEGFDRDRYANGRLPARLLCELPGASEERLRGDAAVAFVQLATAYRAALGTSICVSDGYRPLAEQQVLRRTKPRLAAPPGTSEHGWGQAVDLGCGVQSSRSRQHAWLRENAGRFGWVLPEWARPGGAKPEPWHWEFAG